MWSRAQLKEKAKSAFKRNYWKAIIVTLIVFVIGGASSTFSFDNSDDDSDSGVSFDIFGDSNRYEDEFYYDDGFYYDDDLGVTIPDNDMFFEEEFTFRDILNAPRVLAFAGTFLVIIMLVMIVALIIGFLISVFIYNPLEVGTNRFFFKNLNEQAEVKEIAYAFDHSYKNVVNILFIRDLCILGWSLLFVIPGIVKSYEYMMIPYLLAENPSLTKEQAFALSKQMMTGNKWNAFILDLSFIGWDFLSAFTLGILSVFYVQPYKSHTHAALYEELSLINGRPAFAQQPNFYEYGGYGDANAYHANSYDQSNM